MKILVDIFWGYHVLILIFLLGIRFTIQTNFFQIRHFFKIIRSVFNSDDKRSGEVSSFSALSTALAGSIGTGNLVGVGLAISVGGAGAIFWMWISAFFGMMTVFAEVLLSVRYKSEETIGAFSYIRKVSKPLTYIYGLGCVLSSLAMGNMVQANSVAVALGSFKVPVLVIALTLAIISFILAKKGLVLVTKLTEKLVPFMTLFFFLFSLATLFICKDKLPSVISEIFQEAFSLKAGLSGGMFLAMRIGISRGVFTNEAGLGLSSMAFSNIENKNPVKIAYLGIFQVFIDTTVMCTITALCILCGTNQRTGDFLVLTAFQNALGEFGGVCINICMALFAFATLTATSFYGKVGMNYISKGRLDKIFPLLFGAASFVGAISSVQNIFEVADVFNGLMAIPNIIALSYLFNGFINNKEKKLWK